MERPIYFVVSVSPGGTATDVYDTAPAPMPFLMSQPLVLKAMTALGGCHAVEEAARRYVVAVTEEDFPSRFPSGVVLGGPWGFPNYGATGPLTDQGAYSGYYADPELQQEAARVLLLRAPRPLAECSTLQREGEGHPRGSCIHFQLACNNNKIADMINRLARSHSALSLRSRVGWLTADRRRRPRAQ